MSTAVVELDPCWGTESAQLPSVFELLFLFWGGRFRRAHFLPQREGIAVRVIDTEVLEEAGARRESGDGEFERGIGHGQVVVVIVPDQYFHVVLATRGNGIDVRLIPDTRRNNIRNSQSSRAADSCALVAQQAKHAKRVKHGLIQSVCGQFLKSCKVGLPFEFKGPRYRTEQRNV